jgi:hypothetical protein
LGNFPDKKEFNSETLGELISAEQLPSFLQTLDVCEKGTTLSFTKTVKITNNDNWKTIDYYYAIESDFAVFEKLLKKIIKSKNTKEIKRGLQELLNLEISFVAEAENNEMKSSE